MKTIYLNGNKYMYENIRDLKDDLERFEIVIEDGVNLDYSVQLGKGVRIGKNCDIGFGVSIGIVVTIGEGVKIGSWTKIGDGVKIGKGTKIGDMVTIGWGSKIGEKVRLSDFITIGDAAIIIDKAHIKRTPFYIIGIYDNPNCAYRSNKVDYEQFGHDVRTRKEWAIYFRNKSEMLKDLNELDYNKRLFAHQMMKMWLDKNKFRK